MSGGSRSRRLNLSRRVTFQVLLSQPEHSSHDSRWKPWQREIRAGIPQLSPKPLPDSPPFPFLSSAAAVRTEATWARSTKTWLWPTPELLSWPLTPGRRWRASSQLNSSLLCWRNTLSLWPWTLSSTVSMTTMWGYWLVLVDLHVQSVSCVTGRRQKEFIGSASELQPRTKFTNLTMEQKRSAWKKMAAPHPHQRHSH